MSGAPVTKNMVRLRGGRYLAGDDRFYPEEAPVIELDVAALWVDEHPVTNAEFRRFVKETGHVTVAEIAPSAEQFPEATPDQLQPGSLVFQPSTGPVPLDDWTRWWGWVPGADWRHPNGPSAPSPNQPSSSGDQWERSSRALPYSSAAAGALYQNV